jgi:UV DNA damage endonuclease
MAVAAPEETMKVRPKLGLVCLSSDREISFRAVTRKRLLSLERDARRAHLAELYAENTRRLEGAIDYCAERRIEMYRMTSGLFPFADSEHGEGLVEPLAPELARIGAKARALGIRLVLHPDQFVVLSSDSPAVVANSVAILEQHARVMEMLGLPRSPWASINIHGGKGGRADELVARIADLPDEIRLRLTFENDERAYGAAEILDVCQRAKVAMVFDAHHHTCHEKLASYDDPSIAEFVAASRETWPDPSWQQTHISNGIDGPTDNRHSDFIDAMPASYAEVPWIEVEAKAKELAIERLRSTWRPLAM